MIRFEAIEEIRARFLSASPFPHVAIDDFADGEKLRRLLEAMPDPGDGQIRRSTRWSPERGSFAKRWIGHHWPTLVRWKNALLASGTAGNR